jgi:two-component system chemotaxis sensor kinase CheA
MSMADIRDTFFLECEDLLEALSDGLTLIADGETDSDTVNAVFRAVHSIKGGAGAFALEGLVRFAHRFETVLDRIRSDELAADEALMAVLWRASDRLSDLVGMARDGTEIDPDAADPIARELDALAGDQPEEEEIDFDPAGFDIGGFDLDDLGGPEPSPGWSIAFAPHDALYRSGNDPALILRELGGLGELEVTLDAEAVPLLEDLQPDASHLRWTVELRGDATDMAVEEVFEFVDGACDLTIAPLGAEGGALPDLDALPDLEPEPGTEPETEAVPEAEPEPEAPAAETPAAAPAGPGPKPAAAAPVRAAPKQTIRVDLDRVDRLINVAGELVITQAVLAQRIDEAAAAANSRVAAVLEDLEGLAREIQDSVMAIRAQPVKPLFQRMQRIVREAADATGKPVRFVTAGEGTEVDKSLVEGLSDPLMHMLRNAVDHGLENAERRAAAGKPAEGTVRLSAGHRAGRVVIEVADDGGGIDRKRVLSKAIEKGLVPDGADLTAGEIDQLLLAPGFSTAAEVSDLSGRGVGMDVVQNAIRALGGRLDIASEPGAGTTFSISLPLTLAVLDGMVVETAGERLVVPIGSVVETLRPDPARVHTVQGGRDVVTTREGPLRIVDLGALMGFRAPAALKRSDILIVMEAGASRAAIRVDAILDQRQVVIKGLEANYGPVPGIAAATILGDGRIALIVDPDAALRGDPGPVARPATAAE